MATPKSNQVQTAILVDERTLETVDKIAGREQVSRADILRRAIRLYLEAELRERPIEGAGEDAA